MKALANDPEGDFWIPEAEEKTWAVGSELKEAYGSMFVLGNDS